MNIHNKLPLFLITMALFHFMFSLSLTAGELHPRLMITDSQKDDLIKKINQYSWAKTIYTDLCQSIDIYVYRHQTDPTWFISRYPMFRIPGKRYIRHYTTKFPVPAGWGDAPVPTIRVDSGDIAAAPDGFGFVRPTIEEMIPYDTNLLWLMTSSGNKEKSWTRPGYRCYGVQKLFNETAMKAAFVYWLTGDEKYAIFARDFFIQWLQAAYYMQVDLGPGQWDGYLTDRALADGDSHGRPMALLYDFLYDYLVLNPTDKQMIETMADSVFERLGDTVIHHSGRTMNHNALEMVSFIPVLAINNKTSRDARMAYLLTTDMLNGYNKGYEIGSLPLPTVINLNFGLKGIWMETFGYHNESLGSMYPVAVMAELNEYPAFSDNPALFDPGFAVADYLYPDGTSLAFGDGGRGSVNCNLLEMIYTVAIKSGRMDLAQKAKAIIGDQMAKGLYDRALQGNFETLIWGAPIITPAYEKNYHRAETVEHVPLYIQRNGIDPKYGLMISSYGQSSFLHSHAHGLTFEIYGHGFVQSPDPGHGSGGYGAPMFVSYYRNYAAHNTIVCNMRSQDQHAASLNFREPSDRSVAHNPYCSFVDISETDNSAGVVPVANKRRINAIVRTSDKTGYYIDIFRSDFPGRNDYLYHNLGYSVSVASPEGSTIPLSDASSEYTNYHLADSTPSHSNWLIPGWHHFTEKKSTSVIDNNVNFLFSVNNDNLFMNMLSLGQKNRQYFKAMSPAPNTVPYPYNLKTLPTIIIRSTNESWNTPFIVVYEPFDGSSSIQNIRTLYGSSNFGSFQGVVVESAPIVDELKNRKEYILSSLSHGTEYKYEGISFDGTYGVASITATNLNYLYLGNGVHISNKEGAIKSVGNTLISASLSVEQDGYIYSASASTIVTLRYFNPLNNVPYSNLAIFTKGNVFSYIPVNTSAIADNLNQNNGWGFIRTTLPPGKNIKLRIASKESVFTSGIVCTLLLNGRPALKQNSLYLSDKNRTNISIEINVSADNAVYLNKNNFLLQKSGVTIDPTYYNVSQNKENVFLITFNNYIWEKDSYVFTVFDNLKLSKSILSFNVLDDDTSSVFLYPNPVSPRKGEKLTIVYHITENDVPVELGIYDLIGRCLVKYTLNSTIGENIWEWDGFKSDKNLCDSGIVFVSIRREKNGITQNQIAKVIIK